MATRAAWSKAARRELPPGETLAAGGREGAGRVERGDRLDSRPFRIPRYWLGLWRNPLFRPPTPLNPSLRMDSPERRAPPVQLSFLCPCGKRIELKALGCCRSCYDRRHHSLRFFGGLRERVLERDRFRCRGCGKRSALVVHHRDRHNRANLLVTLCIRCHIRIHHSSGLQYCFSETLVRLWRELHPSAPMQLQLTFRNAEKVENSKNLFEEVIEKALPLLALPNAHAPRN
jgi:hypothetical protein